MSDGYLLDPVALEGDADLWVGWRDDLASGRTGLPEPLGVDTFSLIEGAQDLRRAYETALDLIADYIEQGEAEFRTFAEKLYTTTELYLRAEDASAADIARVADKLAEL